MVPRKEYHSIQKIKVYHAWKALVPKKRSKHHCIIKPYLQYTKKKRAVHSETYINVKNRKDEKNREYI